MSYPSSERVRAPVSELDMEVIELFGAFDTTCRTTIVALEHAAIHQQTSTATHPSNLEAARASTPAARREAAHLIATVTRARENALVAVRGLMRRCYILAHTFDHTEFLWTMLGLLQDACWQFSHVAFCTQVKAARTRLRAFAYQRPLLIAARRQAPGSHAAGRAIWEEIKGESWSIVLALHRWALPELVYDFLEQLDRDDKQQLVWSRTSVEDATKWPSHLFARASSSKLFAMVMAGVVRTVGLIAKEYGTFYTLLRMRRSDWTRHLDIPPLYDNDTHKKQLDTLAAAFGVVLDAVGDRVTDELVQTAIDSLPVYPRKSAASSYRPRKWDWSSDDAMSDDDDDILPSAMKRANLREQ